ncbi:MAG: PAS domain S-box protein [Planctomycetes bacterium]|nr:PAS domain S-box protein [Planctomycetota bacterium]
MSTRPTATGPHGDAQQQYEQLVASVDGIVWELDAQSFQFTFVSQQAERLLGYPLQEWLKPGFWVDHLHPDDRAWAAEFCLRATREKRSHDFEYRMIAADGRTVWLRDLVSVVVESDVAIKLRGIMVDVTDRKQTEEALRESEELFRHTTAELQRVMASVSDYLWSGQVDEQGNWKYHYYSPVVEKITGRPPSFYLEGPERWLETIHPEDRPRLVAAFQRVVAGQSEREDEEYRVVRPDGVIRWVRDCATVTRLGHGGLRIDGAVSDITERKHVEAERQAHLRFLESMDHVNRAMQGTNDLEQMMRDVLDAVLSIFDCDRAWLVYPCDPEAASWWVPMERTRPEYPGAFALGLIVPVDPEVVRVFRTVRASTGPVRFGPGSEHPLPTEAAKRFHVQSQITMAIDPKVDKPYVFGLHQCSYPRVWTAQEERLFQEIGRRLADALTSLLAYRALRVSEGHYRLIVETAPICIHEVDRIGRLISMNPTGLKMMGLTDENQLGGMAYLDAVAPADRPRIGELLDRALAGQSAEFEFVAATEGEPRRFASSFIPIRGKDGSVQKLMGMTQEITERHRAEEALQASEAKYRAIFDNAVEGLFQTTPSGTFLSLNPALARIYGFESPEEVIAHFEDIGHQLYVDPHRRQEFVRQIDAHGAVKGFEFEIWRKDGTRAWVAESTRAVRDVAGNLLWYEGTVEDITERKRAERALVESHSVLNAVIEGASDAIFVKDLQGRYVMINAAGARFIGKPVEAIIGNDDRALFTPDTACILMERDRQVLAAGESRTFEETATAAGVTRTYLSCKGVYRDAHDKVIGLVGIARDVTELKRLEEQFRQAQKMEAVGRLAGGLAHDFNNLLTVINGYSALVLSGLRVDDPNRERLVEIQRSGERAANLTRQLLAFSRKQVLQPQVVNLNTLLGELGKLLRPLIGEDIEVALAPDGDLGLAKVDPGQFEQAITNLAVNARDAMPQGGRLIIETHNAELDEDYAERHPEVRPGRYVLVTVSDTGQGMDEATKARIFEPFFTTKGPGKGTGLGLAMVYGFVKQSGGHVEMSSEWGHGTTFTVYLPRAEETTPSAKMFPDVPRVSKGAETVLLVEDEDAVRTLSRLVLQSNGYTVLEARDGLEAIRVAQRHQGPIHILVTDLVMPRMSGRQLADLLAQARPHARVLFMSGYTDETVLRHGVPEVSVAFLQKPFNPIDLAWKVREVLDSEKEQS